MQNKSQTMKKTVINSSIKTIYQRTSGFRRFAYRLMFATIFLFIFWNMFEKSLTSKTIYCPSQNLSNVSVHHLIKEIQDHTNFTHLNHLIRNVECSKAATCPTPAKKFNYIDFECFQFTKKNQTPIDFLEDVQLSKREPQKGNTIFFLETSCANDGLLHLTPRQACAVESAALSNPKRDIFLLFVTPVGYPTKGHEEKESIMNVLQSYSNIYFRNVNMSTLAADSPIKKWFETGDLFTSKYLHMHVADFLRLLVLYTYGGTYFDMDFIVQKKLDSLKPNFLAEEHDQTTGNSVISFQHSGIGNAMSTLFLHEFAQKFYGQWLSLNGQYRVQQVAEHVCGTNNHSLFSREQCVAFDVHPRRVFYPVEARYWWQLFYENSTRFILNKAKYSYGIHTWNSISKDNKHTTNEPKSAFSLLTKRYCPRVHKLVNNQWFGTF